MAIFADTNLKPPAGKTGGMTPAPAGQAPSIPALSRPPMISDSAVQSMANNQLASGYGTREQTLHDSDRRGISRGKGQYAAADTAQEAADAKGQAAAAQTTLQSAAANSSANQDYQNAMREEQLTRSGLLEQLRNNQAMARIQGQQYQQQVMQAIRRGQFQLDSQYLDPTPLLMQAFFGK